MTKKDIKITAENIIYKFTALSAILFSIGACSPFGTFSLILTCCFACIIISFTNKDSFLPILINFLVMLRISGEFGINIAICTAILAGIITIVFSLLKLKLTENENFEGLISIGTALTVTTLITTDYFGIGAAGYTVIQMIKSYVSLGFHPNWRGILYGTIVMVIMITYPRKFKKTAKIVSAPFVALFVTFILNLFLIPKDFISPIKLISKPLLKNPASFTDFSVPSSVSVPLLIILCIFASIGMAMINIYAAGKTGNKKDALTNGAAFTVSSYLFGYAVPGKVNSKAAKFVEGLIAAVLCAIFFLITKGYERLPLASCAVVLIVGAWQSVNWRAAVNLFKKPLTILLFIFVTAITLLTNISFGVIAAFIIGLIIQNKKSLLSQG